MVGALGRSARLGTIASTAVGVPVLAAGPMLITWLYGPAYAPAGVILPILVAEAVVAGLAQVLLQGFLAAGRPGVATVVLGLGLAGSVPLFLVLVPAFGVTGAAVALLGGSLLRVAFTVAAYRIGAARARRHACGSAATTVTTWCATAAPSPVRWRGCAPQEG